jgi:hypothetical protein
MSIKKGNKVRWYLVGMGSEMDIHPRTGTASWSFYPRLVEYADGSTWEPQDAGECFHISGGTKTMLTFQSSRHCRVEVNAD